MLIIKIPLCPEKTGEELAPEAVAEQLMKNTSLCCAFKYAEIKLGNKDIEEDQNKIFQNIDNLESSATFLGGIHQITYPCFKAAAKKYEGMGLILFDAHPDVLKTDYLRRLIEEEIIEPEKIIIVGVRNIAPEELEFLKKRRMNFITMHQIFDNGIQEVCSAIMERTINWPAAYISLDIDVIDPAFAPGTNAHEPGGFSSTEILYFIRRLRNMKNLKYFDLVEINPTKDINYITSKLGAKIVEELVSAK